VSRSPRDVQRVKSQEYLGRSQGPETRNKDRKDQDESYARSWDSKKSALRISQNGGNRWLRIPPAFPQLVTFLPTLFSLETQSGFWDPISCCSKRIYKARRRGVQNASLTLKFNARVCPEKARFVNDCKGVGDENEN